MHPHRVAESEKLLTRWVSSPCALRFPLYTAYLQSLAAGERVNAVHRYLRPLITELASATHVARLELVDTLCRSVDFRGRVAGTSPVPGLPYELLEQVAIPTLLEQIGAHPNDAYAHLWLAMLPTRHHIPDLSNPRELIDFAYRLSPEDDFIAERVADERLHSVWFACHHLPSVLLSTPDTVASEIEELRRVASRLSNGRGSFYLDEAARYAQQVEEFVRSNAHEDAT